MKTLLVTGASGFLGWNLCCQAAAGGTWRIIGTVHDHPVACDGVEIAGVDLTNHRALTDLFERVAPDAVIHTAAASKPNWCESHPDESQRINVDAAVNIAGLCDEFGAACVFTSSDLIFNGTRGMYSESDRPSPVSRYGAQKLEAEQAMRERNPAVTVCRMPIMYGAPSPVSPSFIQPWLESLRAGRTIELFSDEYRSPVSARCASRGLLMALERRGDLLHLGGRERLSRYEFALIMCDVFGLDRTLVAGRLQREMPMPAARPADVSLDSGKAFALGYDPQRVGDGLRELAGR